MAERRRGLGRGIGALIPDNQRESKDRPFDVFFGGGSSAQRPALQQEGESEAQSVGESAAIQSLTSEVSEESQQSYLELLGVSSQRNASGKEKGTSGKEAEERPSGSSEHGTGASLAGKDTPRIDSQASLSGEETEGSAKYAEDRDAVEDRPVALEDAPDVSGDARPKAKVAAVSSQEAEESTDPGNIADEQRQGEGRSEDLIDGRVASDLKEETSIAEEEALGDDGELIAVPGATYAELPVSAIVPNQRQPRSVFDEEELEELADSIKEVGILQPVIVRPLTAPVPDQPEARYELIMGERRWRASQLAGNENIPAVVRRTADEDLLRDALLENLHRAQLNPLEEAAAYQQLLEDFNCTQEELARRIARSRPQITNTLRLLKLPPLVQRRVAAQVLSAGHARALLGLSDAAAMERVAQRIVAESLSVRQVEEIVAMGDEPQATHVSRRRARRFAPELGDLSGRLTDRFDTRVKVDMGVRKGTIKIDFATIEDLNRILNAMSPDIEAVDVAEDS
ncbi:ParB/RepB/Spo0J family partition protein [Actinomycetaceae bacterium L2_0104]